MRPQRQTPSEAIKYTGPVALNARSIKQSSYTLLGENEKGEGLVNQPIRFSELVNLMNFLEVAVMSNQIFYDGTLPSHERARVQNRIGLIGKFGFGDIKPILAKNAAHLSQLCKGAAEQSSELIKAIDLDTLIENKTDRPLKKYATFEKAIIDAAQDKQKQQGIADEIMQNILDSQKTFTGSKCVAGICLSEMEEGDLTQIVADKFRACQSKEQKEYLAGALINRFRTNYINKLSSQDEYEAAFMISPNLESLQSQQTILLWKYILRRIERKYSNQEYERVKHLFSGQYSTFPLGFAALLHPSSKSPESLLENILRFKHDKFNRFLAKESPQERFFHNFDKDEFLDFQEDLLSESFHKISTKQHPVCNIIINRLPEIIGISATFAFSRFIADNESILDLGAEIGSMIGIKEIAEKGLEWVMPNNKFNVFVNNLDKIGDFYTEALQSNDDLSKRMVSQIETIFQRKLVL